jgi:hypothetical protein
MMHCGYEPTAINDTLVHPLKALQVALKGPRTNGPMAPEIPVTYNDQATRSEQKDHVQPVRFVALDTTDE